MAEVCARLESFGPSFATGVGVGLAGIILTARSGAGIADSGAQDLSLQSITAVLLGGCALSGGRGSVAGTMLGVLLLGVLNNGLVLLNIPAFYQYVAQGSLLVLAVMIRNTAAPRAGSSVTSGGKTRERRRHRRSTRPHDRASCSMTRWSLARAASPPRT